MYVSKSGNLKMSWPTWSIPSVATCPGSTPACRAACYARKAERQYPGCLPCRERNFEVTQAPDFAERMTAWVKRHKPRVFRIHESGDFYSSDYFRAWREVAIACPSCQFFAFSKVRSVFRFGRPSNFTLIWSEWADTVGSPPAGAAVFQTVPRGDVGEGIRCSGGCDSCGVCPWVQAGTRIWAEEH